MSVSTVQCILQLQRVLYQPLGTASALHWHTGTIHVPTPAYRGAALPCTLPYPMHSTDTLYYGARLHGTLVRSQVIGTASQAPVYSYQYAGTAYTVQYHRTVRCTDNCAQWRQGLPHGHWTIQSVVVSSSTVRGGLHPSRHSLYTVHST